MKPLPIEVFRYITNLYEIETINNISITNTNIVNYGDTLGNLIPVNYGETTITLHGASGKTKQITIKVIEEEEKN